MRKYSISVIVALFSLIPMTALAQSYGAVKVECWGRCDLVTLGQICDTYSAGSAPVSVACDDTGVGTGWEQGCGSATCKPYGSLARFDDLADYCDDGGGYDAVVTCATSSAVAADADKQEEAAQQQGEAR